MIKCPNTGHVVSTGMEMDQMSSESGQTSENSFDCPARSKTHTWDKGDAFLTEAD